MGGVNADGTFLIGPDGAERWILIHQRMIPTANQALQWMAEERAGPNRTLRGRHH